MTRTDENTTVKVEYDNLILRSLKRDDQQLWDEVEKYTFLENKTVYNCQFFLVTSFESGGFCSVLKSLALCYRLPRKLLLIFKEPCRRSDDHIHSFYFVA